MCIVTRFGQRRIVGVHEIGVALEHPGDGLGFLAEIILEGLAVVIILPIGIQHALDVEAAVGIAGELIRLAQIGDAVNGETRTFQLGSGTARAGGAHQLAQLETALQDSIQTLLTFPDYIAGLIAIGKSFVAIDFIAKESFGVAKLFALLLLPP